MEGAGSRWRELFSLLNALERRDDADALAAWSTLSAWLAEVARRPVPSRLLLRPDLSDRDAAPPCPGCDMPLRRVVDLVACTACLGVYHRRCLPDGRPCPCEVLDRQAG